MNNAQKVPLEQKVSKKKKMNNGVEGEVSTNYRRLKLKTRRQKGEKPKSKREMAIERANKKPR